MITYFLEIYDQIYNYLTSANFGAVLLILKITSWLISLFLIILIVILLKRADAGWWIRERIHAAYIAYGQPEDKRWEMILARLKRGDEANLKLAVIEADNLLDEILKRMALPGRDMGERLQQFETHELASLDRVWQAHKLRNQIVHEPGIHITQEQAEEAVANIEAALKELEYLS
jgi:hypothetical protein